MVRASCSVSPVARGQHVIQAHQGRVPAVRGPGETRPGPPAGGISAVHEAGPEEGAERAVVPAGVEVPGGQLRAAGAAQDRLRSAASSSRHRCSRSATGRPGARRSRSRPPGRAGRDRTRRVAAVRPATGGRGVSGQRVHSPVPREASRGSSWDWGSRSDSPLRASRRTSPLVSSWIARMSHVEGGHRSRDGLRIRRAPLDVQGQDPQRRTLAARAGVAGSRALT